MRQTRDADRVSLPFRRPARATRSTGTDRAGRPLGAGLVTSQPDDVSGHQRTDCGGPRALRRWQSVPRHGFGTKATRTAAGRWPQEASHSVPRHVGAICGVRTSRAAGRFGMLAFEAPVTVGRTMGYRAVALSQVDGSGAESIGRDVAQQLGFGYLDDAIVAQVASERGVDPAIVSDAEQRKSLVNRLAEMAQRAAVAGKTGPPLYAFDETDMLLWMIGAEVRGAADRGNVVLVAHAACYACADRSDVLRVWVTAPPSTRASRLASALGLSDKEAAKSVRQSDAARAGYLKRVYEISEESNTDYDVVINTERMTTDAAADLIVGLVRAPVPGPEGRQPSSGTAGR